MKTRRTCKEKLLAVLLALAMLLPAVPNLGMVDTAEAASAYTLHEANAGSGGDAPGKCLPLSRYLSVVRPFGCRPFSASPLRSSSPVLYFLLPSEHLLF